MTAGPSSSALFRLRAPPIAKALTIATVAPPKPSRTACSRSQRWTRPIRRQRPLRKNVAGIDASICWRESTPRSSTE